MQAKRKTDPTKKLKEYASKNSSNKVMIDKKRPYKRKLKAKSLINKMTATPEKTVKPNL